MENKLTSLKVGEIAPTKAGLEDMANGIAEQVLEGNLPRRKLHDSNLNPLEVIRIYDTPMHS